MKKRVMSILFALLLAVALVPDSAALAATDKLSDNIFPNGDFETLKDGSTIEPDGWVSSSGGGATNVAGTNYSVITDDAGITPISKGKALKLTMGDSTTGRIMLTASINPSQLELGSTYVLKGYFNLVNLNSGALTLKGSKNITAWSGLSSDNIPSGWKLFSCQFTYDSTNAPTSGDLTFEAKVSGGGTMYVDNISLYKANTLLKNDICFDIPSIASFNEESYDPLTAYRSDSGCKLGEEYTVEKENGNYMLHWHGITQGSIKGIRLPLDSTKLSTLTEGTPIKLSFRIKLTKADASADENGNYAVNISHAGTTSGKTTLGTYYLPKTSLNQWVNVEYWYCYNTAYTGSELIIKQGAVEGIDFLMDDIKLYVEDDSSISTGAVLAADAANLTPEEGQTFNTYTRTSLETAAPSRVSKLTPGVFFFTNNGTEEKAQAITGVYQVENGVHTLVSVSVEELTASINAPAMSTTPIDLSKLTLSADKEYVMQTFLWNGFSNLNPLTNKTIVPILLAE